MPDKPLRYVHLLTLWQERPAQGDQPALWRFSLEDARTRQRRGFASLAALTAFLQAQMADSETASADDPSSP